MDVEAAHDELIRAFNAAASADRGSARFRAARDVLTDRGTQALGVTECPSRSLDAIVEIASTGTMTPSLRAFAGCWFTPLAPTACCRRAVRPRISYDRFWNAHCSIRCAARTIRSTVRPTTS